MARLDGANWIADTRGPDGSRKRMRGFSTKLAAEVWELQAKQALLLGKPLPPGPASDFQGVTLGELLRKTKQLPAPEGWDGALAYDHLVRNAGYFIAWKGENYPAADVTSVTLSQYVDYMKREAGISGATMNRRQAAVTKMFKVGHKHFGLARISGTRMQEGGSRKRIITPEEEATIIRLSRQWRMERFARLTITLIDTGARPGEIIKRLTLGSFFEAPYLSQGNRNVVGIRIDGTKTASSKRNITASTRILDEVVAPMRREGLREDAPMFPLAHHEMTAWWDKIKLAMGLTADKEFIPYAFRHTSVTRMLQRRMDVVKVKDWHGHSSLKTTMGYAHMSLVDMAEVGASLEVPPDRVPLSVVPKAVPK